MRGSDSERAGDRGVGAWPGVESQDGDSSLAAGLGFLRLPHMADPHLAPQAKYQAGTVIVPGIDGEI